MRDRLPRKPKSLAERERAVKGKAVYVGNGYWTLRGHGFMFGHVVYVCLPPNHPDIGKDPHDLHPQVRGGLTFAEGRVFGWDYGIPIFERLQKSNDFEVEDDIKNALLYFSDREQRNSRTSVPPREDKRKSRPEYQVIRRGGSVIWKGIKAIVQEATKELVRIEEGKYLVYSAPGGYELILSGIAIAPRKWRREIKCFYVLAKGSGRRDRIFYRGLNQGEGSIVTDDEEPVLELMKRD